MKSIFDQIPWLSLASTLLDAQSYQKLFQNLTLWSPVPFLSGGTNADTHMPKPRNPEWLLTWWTRIDSSGSRSRLQAATCLLGVLWSVLQRCLAKKLVWSLRHTLPINLGNQCDKGGVDASEAKIIAMERSTEIVKIFFNNWPTPFQKFIVEPIRTWGFVIW